MDCPLILWIQKYHHKELLTTTSFLFHSSFKFFFFFWWSRKSSMTTLRWYTKIKNHSIGICSLQSTCRQLKIWKLCPSLSNLSFSIHSLNLLLEWLIHTLTRLALSKDNLGYLTLLRSTIYLETFICRTYTHVLLMHYPKYCHGELSGFETLTSQVSNKCDSRHIRILTYIDDGIQDWCLV